MRSPRVAQSSTLNPPAFAHSLHASFCTQRARLAHQGSFRRQRALCYLLPIIACHLPPDNATSATRGRGGEAVEHAISITFFAPEAFLPPAMAKPAYSIVLPTADARELELDQDTEWCTLESPERPPRRIRFHDYHEIYAIPGLYERLFHDHLQCRSPQVIRELLDGALQQRGASPQQLRVLDVGAGNGIVGEQLHGLGARHIVGVDIMPEARAAALRDRPGIYHQYLVLDLTDPTPEHHASLRSAAFNAITCVAALGFGDMPPQALARALEYVSTGGYVALTLKNRFLEDDDDSGFNLLLRALLRDNVLSPLLRRTYCHRLSVAGDPLHYHAIVAEKRSPLPDALLRQFQVLRV